VQPSASMAEVGRGAKTASRIAGTAAFLEGYHARDSPIYGAERRGFHSTSKKHLHARQNIPVLNCFWRSLLAQWAG